jgi:hypothetical protein
MLAEELAQGKSARLQQYLAFAARFHQYSRANQWLILAQMPTATRVASYKKWQDEGYQVARGQTGIRILAPSIRHVPQPDSAPEGVDDPESTTGAGDADDAAQVRARYRRVVPSCRPCLRVSSRYLPAHRRVHAGSGDPTPRRLPVKAALAAPRPRSAPPLGRVGLDGFPPPMRCAGS